MRMNMNPPSRMNEEVNQCSTNCVPSFCLSTKKQEPFEKRNRLSLPKITLRELESATKVLVHSISSAYKKAASTTTR
jgi:hypothetical protein